MSRFLVILLIMLLPLHSWSAGRMAVQMAHGQAVAEVADVRPAPVDMPIDCPMLEESDGSISGCLTCQFCMSLADLNVLPATIPTQVQQSTWVSSRASFDSADPKRQAKPPIL